MYIQNKHLDKRDTKYIELAMLLRRTRRSIFKRYQYLKKIEDDSQIERKYFVILYYRIYYVYNFLFLSRY